MESYTEELVKHYENYFGITGQRLVLSNGSLDLLEDFFVLEFAPNQRHQFWSYCSVGMSIDRNDDNLIEVFLFSPTQYQPHVELITICAYYHRTGNPLNLNHTVNLGRSWIENSLCEYCFISLPYLDGTKLELFNFRNIEYHCYWLIPITEKERDYKITNGPEALEELFEEKKIDYLHSSRKCLLQR